ncbi:MAG: integrase arm-type DNA-binding domain-containing protein, partial [Pseudomonadota bacterium]
MHADGDGLYLFVAGTGRKRWTYIFQWRGKRTEMGLGGYPSVSLAKARERAAHALRMRQDGYNPVEVRRREANGETAFEAFADTLIERLAPQFRSTRHVDQWRMTLREYAAPLRSKRLDEIGTTDVLEVLEPIWQTKTETASRFRGRIERVLDAAKAQGLRTGENPARWRGHLNALLPKRQKLTRGHHAAMAYSGLPSFITALREHESVSARALEWTILCAARSSETLGARWEEMDRDTALWTIPARRTKQGREHRVPLTPRMLGILDIL